MLYTLQKDKKIKINYFNFLKKLWTLKWDNLFTTSLKVIIKKKSDKLDKFKSIVAHVLIS